jgi:thymidine kinase
VERPSLEVIYGPMFSGKTGELIARLQASSRPVVAVKPVSDTRHPANSLVAHSGERFPARAVRSAIEILQISENAEIVAIDEGQFFAPDLVDVIGTLRARQRVIVAGLDFDFRGAPFGPIPELIAIADDATALTAICVRCGAPATRTGRKPSAPDLGSQILIGGSEAYEALCDACFSRHAATFAA